MLVPQYRQYMLQTLTWMARASIEGLDGETGSASRSWFHSIQKRLARGLAR